MVALAILFLLFLVLTGASMSAYSTSVRVSQRARAEDLMSTAVAGIRRDLKTWANGNSDGFSQKLGDIKYDVTEESKKLSDKVVEIKVTVSWIVQGRHEHVEKTFALSLKEDP